MRNTIKPDARGRLLLPEEVRKSLGLDSRQTVSVEMRGDGSVVLRDAEKARVAGIKSLRGSARGQGGSVEDLLEGRREEAALEAAKEARLGGGA